MWFFCFVVRLSPFVQDRLTTLSFLAQGFTRISGRAISWLCIKRFGERRDRESFHVCHRILYRKGRGDHFARDKTNNGGRRIKVLPTQNRFIRYVRATFRAARPIHSYHHFLGRLVHFLGSEISLHVVLLRILLQSFRRFSFHFLRRIIRILNFIRDLYLSITNGNGRFTYGGLLHSSAYIVFCIYKENCLTT